MRIKLSNISLNVEVHSSTNTESDLIFFLHGFTGSSEDWRQIAISIEPKYKIIMLDLIGHGKSDSPKDISLYTADSIVKEIFEVINYFTSEKIILAGYSMGGRTALSFAVKHPDRLKKLILESSTPGLKEKNIRAARSNLDEQLASYIESHELVDFIDYWMNIDLFATQRNLPQEKLNEIRDSKLKNNKAGLANSLRGFSTGRMPCLVDQIKNIRCSSLLITGELDIKYTLINSEMLNRFRTAKHFIIKNAGHNTHLEKPVDFINVINDFLNKY